MTQKFRLLFCFCTTLIFIINKIFAQDTIHSSHQVQAIMKEKKSRTLIQQKISSQLLQAIRQKKEPNKPDISGTEPVNINADAQGNLKVDIKAEVTDKLLKNIKDLGGKIIFASKEYRSVRAEVNLSMVEKIAAYSEVKFIEPAAIPVHNPIQPKLFP